MMEVCTVKHEGRYSDEGRHSSTIFNTKDKKQPKYLDPSLDVSGWASSWERKANGEGCDNNQQMGLMMDSIKKEKRKLVILYLANQMSFLDTTIPDVLKCVIRANCWAGAKQKKETNKYASRNLTLSNVKTKHPMKTEHSQNPVCAMEVRQKDTDCSGFTTFNYIFKANCWIS